MTGKFVMMTIAMMAISNAKTLQVGGRSLEVPEPDGFVEVTPEMPGLYGITRGIVDPDNETLAYFIPSEMADAAKAGQATPPKKYFVLKVQGNTEFVALDAAGFGGLVAGVKSSNQMISEEMKSQLGDDYSPAAVVKLRGVAALPPHQESDVVFAYSMLTNSGAFGQPMMSATTSYANVAGKMLILHAYGEESDLEWTRSAAGAWTKAVLAANPKPPASGLANSAATSAGEQFGGGDLKSGVIGAVVGVVLAVLVLGLKKRKKA